MDNIWENLDRLSAILTIVGVSLLPIIRFIIELIKLRKKSKETTLNVFELNYQKKNLLSCFSGCAFSVLLVVLFNVLTTWLYISLVENNVPEYSIPVYYLCVSPIFIALLGGLIGLAVGKKYI